jgi:Domain of unknown function (DUF4157)
MDRESLLTQFESLLLLAVQWAIEQEQRILRDGVSLSPLEILDARSVGVQHPEPVRLLAVETIPRPEHMILTAACDALDFLTPATRGLTLQRGIFIRSDCWRNRRLIAHELVHVAQYERLGGMLPFLRQYLLECVTLGYPEAPLEQEALSVTQRLGF